MLSSSVNPISNKTSDILDIGYFIGWGEKFFLIE